MIKQALLSILFSLSYIYVFSQIDTTKLLYAEKFDSDAFVEFGSDIIQINKSAGMDIGLAVNWLVNHKYYLGAAYGQLASVEKIKSIKKEATIPPSVAYVDTRINYQTGGLRFGYILFKDQKILSFSPDITLGWVGVRLKTEGEKTNLNGAYISPALKGIFNVSNYFRIGVELNYNIFILKDYNSLNNENTLYSTQFSSKNINGISGGIFLRIGQF